MPAACCHDAAASAIGRAYSMTFCGVASRLEIEAIKSGQALKTDNKREIAEWDEKKKELGR